MAHRAGCPHLMHEGADSLLRAGVEPSSDPRSGPWLRPRVARRQDMVGEPGIECEVCIGITLSPRAARRARGGPWSMPWSAVPRHPDADVLSCQAKAQGHNHELERKTNCLARRASADLATQPAGSAISGPCAAISTTLPGWQRFGSGSRRSNARSWMNAMRPKAAGIQSSITR
jgi:hypothetical protein